MSGYNLATDEGLRTACDSIGGPDAWGAERRSWIDSMVQTIEWVRAAGESERRTRAFQQRLWEDNHIAAIGQGRISVDRALDDEDFRAWLAAISLERLPSSPEGRLQLLTALYEALKEKLEPFLDGKVPHLKIFRVLAALYPEAMTTVASAGALDELTRAMGRTRRFPPVERHVWVRQRLDALLGSVGDSPRALAERIALPWMLYERCVQAANDLTEKETRPGDDTTLVPLPAARRRKGLTAIKGLFPGVLSTLEFVREGVTRTELLDFLRASSPESKVSSLGVAINSLKSELSVIRSEGDRYVLTERGEDVLESQDSSHLADWLLTRILGIDKALVELRDRGPLPATALLAAIKSMNPGWTSNFAPLAMVGWMRSLGVVATMPDYRYLLTQLGQQWVSRIHWEPEALPPESPVIEPPSAEPAPADLVAVPALPGIITTVQNDGHFPPAVIARLHAGLWSHARRHFAILTGLSGSGKTLLARSYAHAITNDGADRQILILPVQPGWQDPGSLLGFVNPLRNDSYTSTGFLEFLLAAASDPTKPYVAILDEMNLSHPEQYMAPLLSAMETGAAIQLHNEGDFLDGIPSAIPYPSNLTLIGTVNMDETTHGLSDKVLDRAFVLEFWEVDLDAYPHWGARSLDEDSEKKAREVLTALMEALAPARLHFGWRVVDDVLDFLDRAKPAGDSLPFEAALDGVVYAKILPKLRGEDSPRFREALTRCHAALETFSLTQSRNKVGELKHDLETTGSARFWR